MSTSTATPLRSGAISLSSEDVLRLLEDHSQETLVNMAEKIASKYNQHAMPEADSRAAEQVFRLLLRETETNVRAALAQQVKSSRSLPRDIAMSMAQDVEEVALPVLEHFEAFTPEDLMELVQTTDENSRMLAISRRDHVPAAVSESLIAKGNDEVATSLVNNIGAEINESGMTKMVERFPDNKPLMSALVSRPALSATVAEKLINHVSSSLAKTLKEKHSLPHKDIEQEVEQTRENETLKLVRVTRDQFEIEKLVAQLLAGDRLTPAIILSGLSHGNFAFFETALARMSNVAVSNARTLISDRGELGFRALYNKSGLPEAMFPAVRLLLEVVRGLDAAGERPGSRHYANRVVERLLAHAETSHVENLSYIIALVRRTG